MVGPSARTHRAEHWSVPSLQYGAEAPMHRITEYSAIKKEVGEAMTAAVGPGGGVAYNAEVRARHALEQDGVLAPPSPPPPAPRWRGTAAQR